MKALERFEFAKDLTIHDLQILFDLLYCIKVRKLYACKTKIILLQIYVEIGVDKCAFKSLL